jgi:cytochrome c-type biogenesis protein CcmH
MMLWAILAALAGIAVAVLLLPLLRAGRAGRGAAPREDYDLAVYRKQHHELERDLDEGLLSPEEAESARAEVARRALRLAGVGRNPGERNPDDREDTAKGDAGSPARRLLVALVIALLLPASAFALYSFLGAPDLPETPAHPVAMGNTGGGDGEMDPVKFETLIARLEERVKAAPDQVEGWRLLGRSYMSLGRFDEAAERYREAMERLPEDPAIAAAYGEALVLAANGTVTPPAHAAFERTLALDPEQVKARYYLGLASLQAGKPQDALRQWRELAASAPLDAPWLADLRARIADLNKSMGDNSPK